MRMVSQKEFAAMLQEAFGVPDLGVSRLFQGTAGWNSEYLSYKNFRKFALKNEEYAKLFKSYLDLQATYAYTYYHKHKFNHCI